MREIVDVEGFKKAGPYSLAVKEDNLIFLSGQTGDGATFSEQFKNTMEKITRILKEAGSSLSKVLKVTVYLSKAEFFEEMNKLYGEYFTSDFPARTTLVVSFPNSKVMVEVDIIAQ